MEPFLSPSLDGLRSFRTRPFPWATNAVSTDAMAHRDTMFKRYNARPVKNTPYEPHCLDHQTEGSKSGTFKPDGLNIVTVEGVVHWLISEIKRRWFETLVLVCLMWAFGVVPRTWGWIIKPSLIFIFHGLVSPWLLFMGFLLWLII
jgi:hypothetical protein